MFACVYGKFTTLLLLHVTQKKERSELNVAPRNDKKGIVSSEKFDLICNHKASVKKKENFIKTRLMGEEGEEISLVKSVNINEKNFLFICLVKLNIFPPSFKITSIAKSPQTFLP